MPSWEDVNVVVPQPLVAGGFVVLPRGDALAAKRRPHRHGGGTCCSMNRRGKLRREIEDVLEVADGEHEHTAGVIRAPPGVHLHVDVVVTVDDLERKVADTLLDVPAVRATVSGRRMRNHNGRLHEHARLVDSQLGPALGRRVGADLRRLAPDPEAAAGRVRGDPAICLVVRGDGESVQRRELTAVLSDIFSRQAVNGTRLVGVDGPSGTGKTTLARRLAERGMHL